MLVSPAYALVVEDDADIAALLRWHLEALGFAVLHTHTADAALAHLCGLSPELALVDAMLPGINGGEFVKRLRSSPQQAYCRIVITSVLDPPVLDADVDAVLAMPFSRRDLVRALRQAGQPLPDIST